MKHKIIYLTGFMGAGKSTIGPILANALGWNFFDLDKVIEEKTGKKIKEIFASEGEAYFRRIESEYLTELSANNNAVISLGGGTIISLPNIEIMKKSGRIVYLQSSLESVYKRLRYKRDRPILNSGSDEEVSKRDFMQKVTDLFNSRRWYYEQADITIDTDKYNIGTSVDHIVKEVLKK